MEQARQGYRADLHRAAPRSRSAKAFDKRGRHRRMGLDAEFAVGRERVVEEFLGALSIEGAVTGE